MRIRKVTLKLGKMLLSILIVAVGTLPQPWPQPRSADTPMNVLTPLTPAVDDILEPLPLDDPRDFDVQLQQRPRRRGLDHRALQPSFHEFTESSRKVSVLALVISCHSHSAQWPTLDAWASEIDRQTSGGDVAVVVANSSVTGFARGHSVPFERTPLRFSNSSRHDRLHLLTVRAPDTYCGLPVKVVMALHAVRWPVSGLRTLSRYTSRRPPSVPPPPECLLSLWSQVLDLSAFAHVTHVIKFDDTDIFDGIRSGVRLAALDTVLADNATMGSADYLGHVGHIRKLGRAQSISYVRQVYPGRIAHDPLWADGAPSCDEGTNFTYVEGGKGMYILSRRALRLITSVWPLDSMGTLALAECAEDVTIAKALAHRCVTPQVKPKAMWRGHIPSPTLTTST